MGGPAIVSTDRRDRLRFALCAGVVVIALRCLYLARFGWDGCWMNYNFLLEAKAFALGKVGEAHGLPLTPLLVWVFRRAGLGALGALGAVYLVGQGLFLFAAISLFHFFEPRAPRRRQILFFVVLAVIPMLSSDTGYKDLAVLLGAGLLLSALACALAASAADAGSPIALLASAVVFATLGGACRLEAVGGTGLMALLLFTLGRSRARPLDGVRRPFAAGLALLLGSGLGILLALALSFVLRGKAQISSPTYSFYTFYDGLPYLMRAATPRLPGEYGRYLASVDHFGSFAENHGSLVHALLSHPGKAFLRFALKIPDLLVGASSMRGLTPAGLLLIMVGLRGSGRAGTGAPRSRAILLLAFFGPFVVLFIPPASDFYILAVVFPPLLAITSGLDRLLARCSQRTIGFIAASSVVTAGLLIAAIGRTERSNSRVINQAAAYLETECQSGCLVNYLPQQLSSQAWVDLEAGEPFPPKVKRSEDFVLGHFPPGYEQGCRFQARVERARRDGHREPILYLDVRVAGAKIYDVAFDPEHQFDGHPDLSRARLRRRFEQDGDAVSVYQLGDPEGDVDGPPASPAAR